MQNEFVSERAYCRKAFKEFYDELDEGSKKILFDSAEYIGINESREENFFDAWTDWLQWNASSLFVSNNFSRIRYNNKIKNKLDYYEKLDDITEANEGELQYHVDYVLSFWRMFLNVGLGDAAKVKKNFESLKRDNEGVNHELNVAHSKIKAIGQRKIDRTARNHIRFETRIKFDEMFVVEILKVADTCRKKNGKISFLKLGKNFNVSHHTAKKWYDRASRKLLIN